MSKHQPKVKTSKLESQGEKSTSPNWDSVLVDIQADIAYLKSLIPIVERKIERGEPWPGNSATRN